MMYMNNQPVRYVVDLLVGVLHIEASQHIAQVRVRIIALLLLSSKNGYLRMSTLSPCLTLQRNGKVFDHNTGGSVNIVGINFKVVCLENKYPFVRCALTPTIQGVLKWNESWVLL